MFSEAIQTARVRIHLSLSITNPDWKTIFDLPLGSKLLKGRHGLYHQLVAAAAQISTRFGCYGWCCGDEVYYCGSFSQDYARSEFKSNLHGRLHNYLQNHRTKATGHKNTNLVVFEHINESLEKRNIQLKQFTFESLRIGDDLVDFSAFSTNRDLVKAVESILICSYRRIGLCTWNRT